MSSYFPKRIQCRQIVSLGPAYRASGGTIGKTNHSAMSTGEVRLGLRFRLPFPRQALRFGDLTGRHLDGHEVAQADGNGARNGREPGQGCAANWSGQASFSSSDAYALITRRGQSAPVAAAPASHGAAPAPRYPARTGRVRARARSARRRGRCTRWRRAEDGHGAPPSQMGPRSLQRLFEEDGSTFSAFKLEQQLLLVRRLLASRVHTSATVTAVAFAAGFCDLSYFHRSFRRRFGITPADFRANLGKPS
jgi:hypothetical protein